MEYVYDLFDGGTTYVRVLRSGKEPLGFCLYNGQEREKRVYHAGIPATEAGLAKCDVDERKFVLAIRNCRDTSLPGHPERTTKMQIDDWLRQRSENDPSMPSDLFIFDSDLEREQARQDALAKYEDTVYSGVGVIVVAQEMEELFEEVYHALYCPMADPETLLPIPRGRWTSTAFLAQRYQLDMEVDVETTPDYQKVLGTTPMVSFSLTEITDVRRSRRRHVADFGPDEWQEIVEARGDFSVIGLSLILDDPVPHFEEHVARQRRMELSRLGRRAD